MRRLWVCKYVGGQVPSPEFFPDFEELGDVIAADQFFTLIEAEYDTLNAELQHYPYVRLAGHPADGRWISEGGDEVYILNATVVTREELAEGLGLKPADFGGEAWDDVDWDIVWDHIPSF